LVIAVTLLLGTAAGSVRGQAPDVPPGDAPAAPTGDEALGAVAPAGRERERERQVWGELGPPSAETRAKLDALIGEVLDAEVTLELSQRRSRLFRTKQPVFRFSITNPSIVELLQFGPTDFELIGGAIGETTMTLWFGPEDNPTILRYLVQVRPVAGVEYGELQERINELFPNSVVQLIPVLDKLIVRGQARDSAEAARILGMIRGQSISQLGELLGPGATIDALEQGQAAPLYPGAEDVVASNVINLLEVPGEKQVLLKVRIADLSRSALRSIGTDITLRTSDLTLSSLLSVSGSFSAVINTEQLNLLFSLSSSNGYSKMLAEPNLVTLNGQTASFQSGGSFAVPTVVGVGGAQAATTSFQSFGTQLTFTPTILDKDRIRLQVQPTVSSPTGPQVGGIPGLDTRTVSTTVDLREGQWLLIAGLTQDSQAGSKGRLPVLGEIPILDTLFSRRAIERNESELVILVSPELVDNLEMEEAPLILPGMEVTEPNDWQFYLGGRYEGDPKCDYRSTVWPVQQREIFAAMAKAWGEARRSPRYQKSACYYLQGEHGFSP